MNKQDVINHFRDTKRTAEALTKHGWKITSEAVSQWGEYPPKGRQFQIQVLTGGQLQAEQKAY